MNDFKKRIQQLSPSSICLLMGFNVNDTSFGSQGETREMLNKQLIEKFENDEIDEIELLIIEDGE